MEKKEQEVIYYIGFEELKDKNILHNHIYKDENLHYYVSEDFSNDFYIYLAYCGFISTSFSQKNTTYLLPEIQLEYAILDFEDLHISKKVKNLIRYDDYKFSIDENLGEVIEKIQTFHEDSWINEKYKNMLLSLKNHKNSDINFELKSIELRDKYSNELIAGEIGYKIGLTYTSLTGFSSKQSKYKNWGKLQLVLLANYLKQNNYSFWNLGHPHMDYKLDLGAKIYSREDFLKRWFLHR